MADFQTIADAFNQAKSQQLPPLTPLDTELRLALKKITTDIILATKGYAEILRKGEREFVLTVCNGVDPGVGSVKFWLGNGPGVREVPVYLGPEKNPKNNGDWAYPNIDCVTLGDLGAEDNTDLAAQLLKRAGEDMVKARRTIHVTP